MDKRKISAEEKVEGVEAYLEGELGLKKTAFYVLPQNSDEAYYVRFIHHAPNSLSQALEEAHRGLCGK